MNFSIEQVIGLSKQGFSADHIKAFDAAMTPAQVPMVQPQVQPMVQPQVQPMVQPQPQPVYQPQPTQLVYQPQPQVQQVVQPTQSVNQPQVQPAQPVYQPQVQPQVQPAQPVYQPQPMPEGNGNDTSMALLNIIQNMQKNNLSKASGAGTKPETALDVGLDILGMNKGGNK